MFTMAFVFWYHKDYKSHTRAVQENHIVFFSPLLGGYVYIWVDNRQISVADSNNYTTLVLNTSPY
jgi:hypothetical protein